ncbi:hypothetical protein B0P06_006115 [Clostridium saccharoperbutylacetonicum]|uniref:Uncharacterized protein n=1 Tax=Clostridium saccharoperbutylacetonicum N1-4(HMT) TaxID=931276 RepID=M1MYM1_9CLOT|nr:MULTISPECIES: hypothetical protein [Clostridium]AGF59611.1 hypothetical protein Cspa_135p00510 [Clostridium saccharoperbutylacetonicum N1-4(HMT)]NRT64532.1 hypothetical protein [Clostridium saccharoperbutylacetonicum]NSB29007.1 hypothetical protein [Clostridium saccharoperbutylacetonicum]NSB46222.1 hypothetical protein [Clostridium saccharoperbutylacetonicum]OOM44814.1 hypothetical protein CLBKI_51570 [Clostridium beijerinckii]
MGVKTVTFNYTGIMQTWIPPEGVYRIKIECYGAKGGGLTGGMGANNTSSPATQTSGYAFGRGQDAWSVVWDGNGGNIGQGGGGWYGGYTSAVYPLINLYKPFMIDGVYYFPNDILDYANSKICIIDINKDSKLDMNYIPSNIALSKTNIKVKNKYTPVHYEFEHTFLDINSNDKLKVDYF